MSIESVRKRLAAVKPATYRGAWLACDQRVIEVMNHVPVDLPLALDVIEAARKRHGPMFDEDRYPRQRGHCRCGIWNCEEQTALDAFEASP